MRFSRFISVLFFFLPNFLIANFLDNLGPAAKLDFGSSAYSVNWSSDNKYLAIGGDNGSTDVAVYGWDSSISSTIDLGAGAKLDFGTYALSVNWSPDDKYLAIGGNNGSTDVAVYEWNSSINSMVDLGAGAKLDFGSAYSVNWSPDGKYLAIGRNTTPNNVAVYGWNSSSNSFVDLDADAKLTFGGIAYSVKWSPDGKYIAIGGISVSTNVAVYGWNSSSNSFVDLGADAKLTFGTIAYSVDWSPDGKYLAIGGNNGSTDVAVYEWNSSINSLVDLGAGAKLPFGTYADSVNWSPDSKYLAIGGDNGTTDVAVYLSYDAYLMSLITQNAADIAAINGSIFDSPLTSNLTLQYDFHIAPGQRIEIANTLTLDGQGATVEFSNPSHAQFIVRPGCIVTLKNIELDRINSKTFDLRWQSFKDPVTHKWTILEGQINIGENVIFSLSENVTFSQGLINLIQQTNGEPSIFYFKSFEGKNKFILNPSAAYKQAIEKASRDATITDRLNQFNSPILIQLNENTLALQEIDLFGVDHISNTINNYIGAIGLIGNTSINFGNEDFTISSENQKMGLKETYNMVFVTEGIGNSFVLLKDDLLFSGELTFADEGENSLQITTMLQQKIVNPADDSARIIPLVNFGTGFMYLTSPYGRATVNFTDQQIRINNSQNGFIAEENSILKGNRIEIYGDCIWDLSNPYIPDISFVSMVNELLAPDQELNNTPIVPSIIFNSPQTNPYHFSGLIQKHKTALHLKYQKNRESLKTASLTKNVELPNPSRKVLSFFNIKNQELANAQGNIEIDGTNVTKFSASNQDINMTIKNGSTVTLGSDEYVYIEPQDIINIVGTGNEIRIQKNLYVEGQFLFAPNSELKIVFLNPNASIIFATDSDLTLEQGTKLTFDGPGTVEIEDESYIYFNGQKNAPYTNPTLVISNRASLLPAEESAIQFAGVGSISITEGGSFGVHGDQQIIIGESSSDEIDISVAGGILEATGNINGNGIISLQKGTFSLSASLGGVVCVGDKGLLEINTLDGELAQGNFVTMFLDPNGQFALNNGGKISFASNLNEPEILGKQYIIWESINTIFSSAMANNNAGIVEYISGTPPQGYFYRGFAGRLQLANAILNTGINGVTAEQLVRTLINQLDPAIFPTATLLTNSNNEQFIRLKNGVLIAVIQGDTFKSESTDGSINGLDKNYKYIIYALNGTRQVVS